VIRLFKAHKNIKQLIDNKNPQFLKGQLSPKQQIQGARIVFLPNGKQLDKGYSLFATHLKIHDQDSEDHWDVIFQNIGSTWAYCYTLEKKKYHQNNKYKKVQQFEKIYPKLTRNVTQALRDNNDQLAVPMYTLLKTKMRIGNEIYYKAHRHKGLTTLKKKDVKIEGNKVIFNYIAKDGVPRLIEQKFPTTYIKRLKNNLKSLKENQFVFASETGHPLKEQQFKKSFLRYCGKEFYPHIVRSYYATSKVKEFIKNKKKITKEEMQKLFFSLAATLGHKKFIKKEQQWKDNYYVTINHYVQPRLVEKINSLVK